MLWFRKGKWINWPVFPTLGTLEPRYSVLLKKYYYFTTLTHSIFSFKCFLRNLHLLCTDWKSKMHFMAPLVLSWILNFFWFSVVIICLSSASQGSCLLLLGERSQPFQILTKWLFYWSSTRMEGSAFVHLLMLPEMFWCALMSLPGIRHNVGLQLPTAMDNRIRRLWTSVWPRRRLALVWDFFSIWSLLPVSWITLYLQKSVSRHTGRQAYNCCFDALMRQLNGMYQ